MAEVQLSPYLAFVGGTTREVMDFYKGVFGGELTIQTFGEAKHPDESKKDLVMHARLTSDAVDLMASDGMDDSKLVVGNNISLSLSGTDEDKLRGFWDSLAEGGIVEEPLRKAPWGDEFGMLTDKFGIHWMVNITKQ